MQTTTRKQRLGLGVLLVCLASPGTAAAQSVFAAMQSATLPTAAPSRAGNLYIEISHRFGYLSGGASELWGLDGFVLNRLGLAFTPEDHLTIGVLRSNSLDNLEFNARVAGMALDGVTGPIEFAAQTGVAWNLQDEPADDGHAGHGHALVPRRSVVAGGRASAAAESNEMQAYVQAIANTRVADRIALGVVPTLLWNPRIEDSDRETTVSVGVNGQLYLSRMWSLFGEWILSGAREGQEYDSVSFGVEIRTPGHFFKIVVTNQHQMNPTHTLAGSAEDFLDASSWRLGFNIQRRLRL